MRAVLGREPEIEQVLGIVQHARERSGGLVIDGAAGLGKTALLGLAVEHATHDGFIVRAAQPTPAETPLAFAALGDLVRDLDLRRLAPGHRQVIEIAVGRQTNDGPPPTASELGNAFVGLVETLTMDGPPLLVVVDDVQWVDAATRDMLTFAMRRLPARGVCVLVSERTPGVPLVDGLDRLSLPALSPTVIEALLRDALPGPLPRHVLDRVVTIAAGNPLYAIEVGRAMKDIELLPGRPLPVPASLSAAIAERFRHLPTRTVEAVAATAMLANPTLRELAELDLVDDLAPAEVAGIVEIRGREIHFTHPLLAAAAHDAIPASQRLALHRRLAGVTTGAARCIHVALGATHPDAALAAELTDGVAAEVARGASAEAADLMVLALGATPGDDPLLWSRLLMAGDVLFRSGRTHEAIAHIEQVVADAPDGDLRARALLALATIEYSRSDDAEAAATLARMALASTTRPDLLAEAHTILSRVIYTDFVEAAEHADAALAIIRVREGVDPYAVARALSAAACARFLAGDGLDRAAFDQAIVLEQGSNEPVSDSAFAALAAMLKYADQLDESRQMLESLTVHSDPGSLPFALGHLPQLHVWAGRWDDAERCARRHLTLAEETAQESQVYAARFNLAFIAAYRGDVAAAHPSALALYEEGRAEGVPWTERNGAALLGFLAMSSGDAPTAVRLFARYDELGELMRLREPGYQRFHGDYLEALVAVGEVERAASVLERIEPRNARLPRPSALAAAHRGRALIAAHRGDRDTAVTEAVAAVDTLRETPLVYDQARALLTQGVIARRFKERGDARDLLSQALAHFERMGAASLSARARREIERVGGRVAAPGAALAALTATERSVALLAAGGHTTRQIADSLFISGKTVEANLTRVYRKLGVSNRAQLANSLATAEETSGLS